MGITENQDMIGTAAAGGGGGAPDPHAATHQPGGADAMAVDAVAGTGSLRTLGTGATAACAGNDSRLSDARTPTAHASSHQSGGADSVKLDDLATPDDNTDLNATTGRHGLLPKLGGGTSNFLRADGTWAAPSGGAVLEEWMEAGNLAQPSSTTGLMYKTPKVGVNNATDGWAQPISSPWDDMVNGNVDPFLIPETGKLTEVRIWFAAAAVSTGTVGTPSLRLSFFKIQSDGTGRDSLGTRDIPVSSTGIGIYNNLAPNSPQSVLADISDISVSAGDLVGWEFTNVSGSNDGINAVSRLKTAVHFVADA